ncbi:hypothetical protein EYF80_040521 [Liparis tanakae]|uniref:Uncharacterized protein n=1 Tax=Liparis tanakae TaxID=230148 RepID=A0A4Z2G8Z6_9TELE|nr:hypothetical protein EYF80_040521 [Liparis tanakae]
MKEPFTLFHSVYANHLFLSEFDFHDRNELLTYFSVSTSSSSVYGHFQPAAVYNHGDNGEPAPSTCPITDVLLRRSPHRMFSVSHSNLINAGRPLRIYTIPVDDLF